MNLLEQTFALLVTPPGNLVYHLVLLFSLSGALWLSWSRWLDDRFPQQKRAVGGLFFLLLVQTGLFVISALGWQGILNLPVFLPPLQRALSLLMLIWVTWLWLFPEPSSSGDALLIITSVLVIAGGLLSLADWGETPPGTSYNLTLQATLWGWVTLAWLALSGLLMLIRRPNGWGYGIAFVTLGFLGQLLTLLLEHRGDYPGGLRLTELAAYPLLFSLSSRFPTRQAAPSLLPRSATTKSTESAAPPVERRRYSADPKTVHALLEISADPQGAKFHINLARAVSQVMLADLCFVIYLGEEGRQLIFAGGYDLIREEAIEGAALSRDAIPMLANSLQRGRPLRLPASSTSADVRGLSQLLGLEQAGHLLMVPIQDTEKEVFGGLLLLSPYSNRLWSAEDQTFLANIAKGILPLLEQRKRLAALQEHQNQVTELRERLSELEVENRLLQEQVDTLKATLEEKQTAEAQAKEQVQELTRLLAEAQQALQQMHDENARLQLQLERRGTSEEVRQLEGELRNALIEVARLQNQLGEANARILELEKALEHAPTSQFEEKAEVIASIAQELRQPLSSLIGYTDLLLGESVGILGAMQRKFVERIKASIERMRSLVDDLIQVTLIEGGLAHLKPEPVDLNKIIDAAMAYTSGQMREKNITLHLDLPKDPPPIYADPEALQQILIHLLQNATLASPTEGEVRLRVEMKDEKGQEFILLQVSDSGGGIAEEDLPRVFTRLYRAENVLIQGVGDTGIGLSLAKTLTEANGGRIWVQSNPGVGATFSVLLPVARL